MTARSDAHALHTILAALRQAQGKQAISATWSELLGANSGSLEFARRHAEVVALYRSVAAHIEVMPARSRQRYERHAYFWWSGVMASQYAWSSAAQPNQIITQDALDQLDSAAELIEARMEGALDAPDTDALEGLQDACREWLDAIDAEGDIPASLRLSLRHDLEHVLWLIENAHLFGAARVASAAQTVVGNLAVVSTAVPAPTRGVWLARAKKFVQALVTFSALLQGFDVGLALAPGAVDVLGEITQGPSAPPSTPGDLGSGGPAAV